MNTSFVNVMDNLLWLKIFANCKKVNFTSLEEANLFYGHVKRSGLLKPLAVISFRYNLIVD